MDGESGNFGPRRSGSFGRASSGGSSLRRQYSNLSFAFPPHEDDDDVESETVSEAGDIGDRALHINRYSGSGRQRFSFDGVAEHGAVVPVPEDAVLRSSGFWSRDSNALHTSSPVSPTTLEIISPLSSDAILPSGDWKKDNEKEVPWLLEYITCLLSLAVFGILGVVVRYYLQKLFGPGVVGATSDQNILYLDLPSNMVGSFLMGWFGVVFKGDIAKVSDQLAIGLSTGFLGSLTTFSGWNQKMLDLSVKGRWTFAVLGILIGLFLAAYSIIFGIETARGLKWLLRRSKKSSDHDISRSKSSCALDKHQGLMIFMVSLLVILGLLWGVFGGLEKKKFKSGNSEAQLFLACLVGPIGVWIRWFLARFNGSGVGKAGMLKWMPFGTLAANILAASVMAALATLKKAVKTQTCDTVASGLQLGLLGCLSTVSTFIAEFHAMRQSKYPWRAYAYAMCTIVISFILGTLIYSVPVWTKGYD